MAFVKVQSDTLVIFFIPPELQRCNVFSWHCQIFSIQDER